MTWTPLQLWIFDELNRTLGPARAVPAPPVVDLESMLSTLGAASTRGLVSDEELQNHSAAVSDASPVTVTWTSRAWLDVHATVAEHLGVVAEDSSGAAEPFEIVNGEHAAGLRTSVVLWADGEGRVLSFAVLGILGSGWLTDLLRGLVPGVGPRTDRGLRKDLTRAYRVASAIDTTLASPAASVSDPSACVSAEVARPYDHRAALSRRASAAGGLRRRDVTAVADRLNALGLLEEGAERCGPVSSSVTADADGCRVWSTDDATVMLRLDEGRALGAEHSGRFTRARDAIVTALGMRSLRPLGGAAWSPASSSARLEATPGPLRVTLRLDPTGTLVSSWEVSGSLGRDGVVGVLDACLPDDDPERPIAAAARIGFI